MAYEALHHGSPTNLRRRLSEGDDDSRTHVPTPGHPRPARFSPDRTHQLISITAGTVMALFGYEQGVFGGILVGDNFKEAFNYPDAAMTGFVTSVYDLGCFAGALLTLAVGERLGRKRMLLVFTVIMTTGILIQTGAQTMSHLVWGRFIAGIGNGGNTATAPVWHVETALPSAKGQAVVKDMTVNVFGFVISNIITLLCSGWNTDAQWRFPLGIQVVFCITIFILVPILPESPRWLLSRGRDTEAKQMLDQLTNDDASHEFQAIRSAVREEMAVEATWASIFRGGTPTRRLILGMMLQVCQQLSGINLYCYYIVIVLHESVGLPKQAARWLAIGIAILYTIATGCSFFLVERLGRRRLLMWLSAALSLACVGVAISTELEAERSALIPGIVATVFMTLYFIAFGLGWVAIPWLYPAEVNSLSMRTKGAALATSCDWLFNYIVVQTTPIGMKYLHWGIYLIYAVLNAAFVPLIYYFVVETAGLSLEQIDRWFAANPGWRVDKASMFVPGTASGVLDGSEDREGLMKPAEENRSLLRDGKGTVYDVDAEVLDESQRFAVLADSDTD